MADQAPKRSRSEAVRQALSAHGADVVIIAALVGLFVLTHRFLEEVEFGGDAVEKWQFARQWSYSNDFSHAKWTHHMARVGVNTITFLIHKIFGRNWRVYYVGPFFMAALQVPFMYVLAKRLGGRLAGILSVLLITYLMMVHRSASQLLPDGYAGTYAIVSCYVYVRFLEAAERTRLPWLIGLGVVSFAGYLAKETFVLFYPGLVVAVWLVRKSPRDVIIFLGVLLVGLLLESAAYSLFTDYWGRYAIIRGTHLAGADEGEPSSMTFWDLFDRYDELHNATKYLMFFAFGSALWLSVFRKDEQPKARAIVLIGLSHVFFLTFMVRSIHPLDLWQGLDPRYMEPATPFLGIYAGSFLALAVQELLKASPSGASLLHAWVGDSAQQALWSCAAIGLIAYATYSHQRKHPPLDAFARGKEIAGLMNRTYDRNLPILERSGRAKVLTAIYDVYLDDERLARDGKLPNLDDVELRHRNITYLVKNRKQYGKGTLSRLMEEGCFIAVGRGSTRNPHTRDKRNGIGIEAPGVDLPPRCDALLAEEAAR